MAKYTCRNGHVTLSNISKSSVLIRYGNIGLSNVNISLKYGKITTVKYEQIKLPNMDKYIYQT